MEIKTERKSRDQYGWMDYKDINYYERESQEKMFTSVDKVYGNGSGGGRGWTAYPTTSRQLRETGRFECSKFTTVKTSRKGVRRFESFDERIKVLSSETKLYLIKIWRKSRTNTC